MTTETCRPCTTPEMTKRDLAPGENLALCQAHWSRWVAMYLGNPAPCAAHLILGPKDADA